MSRHLRHDMKQGVATADRRHRLRGQRLYGAEDVAYAPTQPGRVLIIDDDEVLTETLASILAASGYKVGIAMDARGALEGLERDPVDLALLDLRLGLENGMDLLPRLKAVRPEMSVVVLTAAGNIETAVLAMRAGADNFVVKAITAEGVLAIVAKEIERSRLRRKDLQLMRLTARGRTLVLGESRAMKDAFELAAVVSGRDTTVLLTGETGTGKGVLARRIHELSPRRHQPFVELLCAGLNRDLTESELFGHERGSFTGAMERKIGLFEAASGGTLFLDEVGELAAPVQAKLLNVLEERRYRRVGGVAEIEVDARLIAATNRDLEGEVMASRFREDLLYRLNVFVIRVPSLRERPEDILPLARHFLGEFLGRSDVRLSSEAEERLATYDWRGNVRELRNVMERAAILTPPGEAVADETILLPTTTRPSSSGRDGRARKLKEAERDLLVRTLRQHGGNVRQAARDLGIARVTMYRKLKRHGIPLHPS